MGDDEWDDPPGVYAEGDADAPGAPNDDGPGWPTHGFTAAAWTGWLALGYAVAAAGRALLSGALPSVGVVAVAVVGAGLLLGVALGGGDPRAWRGE